MWMDNCSSQNKNWALFLHIILLINSNLVELNSIEFAYLEPGHTFNACDSFHHQVELQLKLKQKIYDYDDFTECVENATTKPVNVIRMNHNDFFTPTLSVSQYQLNKLRPRPYVADIKRVRFHRGTYDFQYSTNFTDDFKKCCLLTKKQLQQVTKPGFKLHDSLKFHSTPEGISEEQKQSVIKHLTPLMPPEKAEFWQNVPVIQKTQKKLLKN